MTRARRHRRLAARCVLRSFALLVMMSAPACVSLPDEIEDATCPPEGTELTWENFGRGFMHSYCVDCHGGPNGYSSRALNTVENVRAQRTRIYANSAAGNTAMPPGPVDPSREERDLLAEWLVCGAP